jgi:hypothetical protein
MTAMPLDNFSHVLKADAYDVAHVLGIEMRRKSRRSQEIASKDGHLPPFSAM